MVWSKGQGLFFSTWVCNCASTICWKESPFLIELPWHLCWESIDPVFVWVSSCSFFFCLYFSATLSDFCSFVQGQSQCLSHPMEATPSWLRVGIPAIFSNVCRGLNQGPLVMFQVTCLSIYKVSKLSLARYSLYSSRSRAMSSQTFISPFPSLSLQCWPQKPFEVENKDAKVSIFLQGHFSESSLRNWKEELHNGNHFAASSTAIYLNNHFI